MREPQTEIDDYTRFYQAKWEAYTDKERGYMRNLRSDEWMKETRAEFLALQEVERNG